MTSVTDINKARIDELAVRTLMVKEMHEVLLTMQQNYENMRGLYNKSVAKLTVDTAELQERMNGTA